MAAVETASGRPFWRLSWSAVIAGVLLALASHIVLGLIGAALGFAASPADSKALGAGAAAWALLTPFVASLLGAWLACRMAERDDAAHGNLHGILVWCIGLIAGALFLTGTMASGAMSAGTAASGNLGAAERITGGPSASRGGEVGALRANGAGARDPATRARSEDAAKAASAATGAAALAAVAGLLGALAGAALSRRREGPGWRLAIQRRDEARPGERAVAGRTATGAEGTRVATPSAGASTDVGGVPPADPFHH